MERRRRVAIALRIDEPYPHHQEVFAGIQRFAQEHNSWECLIDEHPGRDHRRGSRAQYDGVIARATPATQRRVMRLGIPLVTTLFQTHRPGLPCVFADPWAMGRIAAEHLIHRAFRRICVLIDRRHKHGWQVCQGFIARASENPSITCTVYDFPDEPFGEAENWFHAQQSLDRLLTQWAKPIAVFAETAPIARLLAQLAQARHWQVPQDIAILCAHNLKAVVSVPPQISSVESNYERVGFEAAALLDRLMNGSTPPDRPIYIPPRGIVTRRSTDCFAVDDPVVASSLKFIANHIDRPLRLSQVADAVAVSPRLLQQRFRETLGRSLSDEIRRQRLEAAMQMLSESDEQIRHIATACGFRNADIMSQIFRREIGTCPREYRKQILGQ